MKKFVVCIIFFTSLCVGFALVTEFKPSSNVSISTDYVSKPSLPEVKLDQTEFSLPTEEYYKLKEYQGNLAIFKKDSSSPIKITSISIEDLPLTDQEMLKKGVEVSSEEEINVLLEDYGS